MKKIIINRALIEKLRIKRKLLKKKESMILTCICLSLAGAVCCINMAGCVHAKTKNQFYVSKISKKTFAKMKGKSFKSYCKLPKSDLRYVHVLHKNLQGETCEGELVCNKKIAKTVMNIFKKLYKADYPIERIRLVDEYDADDEKSMRANNSSSFNYRTISYTNKISKHGLGLAVDINTLYNPYVKRVNGKLSIEPATAKKYVDRSKDFPCKITHKDLAYKLFKKAGFEWGGDWKSAKDYQHFEIPTKLVNKWYPKNK